ncbi:MAG: hypothetical protein JWQ07_1244 [Ramlibacter sp.]|nr:hypothetical protein [Ramlibacter sp.]
MFDHLRRDFPRETGFTGNAWRYPLWQVANQPDLFAYKASNGADGICLLERVDLPDGRIVIACISIVGNPGQSITNAVEEICFQVCERFEIPPEHLIWLEHYENLPGYEEWSWVTFEQLPPASLFRNPTWRTMTPALWRQLGLKPRAKLLQQDGYYESMLDKEFPWPCDSIV